MNQQCLKQSKRTAKHVHQPRQAVWTPLSEKVKTCSAAQTSAQKLHPPAKQGAAPRVLTFSPSGIRALTMRSVAPWTCFA